MSNKMNLRRLVIKLAVVALAGSAGCYSQSYGTSLDSNKISQIQKQVTTRAQVEELLGPPSNVSMMGDGRRTMMYTHVDTDAHAKPTSFIPYVNMFAGGTTGETHTQTLQVVLDKDNVVQDFEFNNNTKNIDSSVGVFGTHTEVTDAPNAK